MTLPDRRDAARQRVPPDLSAEVNGVPVRVVDLTRIGAKVEHEGRFPLTSPQLLLRWRGRTVQIAVQAVRSQIVGKGPSAGLLYQTGLHIGALQPEAEAVLSDLLSDPAATPVETEPVPPHAPDPPPARPSLDDSWIRQVNFLKQELEEDLPYAQFRLHEGGWRKEYVASPEQPEDGFTIKRGRDDFHELQRAFETADEDTRSMMRVALQTQLLQTV